LQLRGRLSGQQLGHEAGPDGINEAGSRVLCVHGGGGSSGGQG